MLNGHPSRKQNLDRQWQHTAQFRNCSQCSCQSWRISIAGFIDLREISIEIRRLYTLPISNGVELDTVGNIILFTSEMRPLCYLNQKRRQPQQIWHKNLLCLKLFFCLCHVCISSVHLAWVEAGLKCLWIFWRLSSFSHYVNFIQNESFPSNFCEHSLITVW